MLRGASSDVSCRLRGAFQTRVAKTPQTAFRSKSVAFFPKFGFRMIFLAQESPGIPWLYQVISLFINKLKNSC